MLERLVLVHWTDAVTEAGWEEADGWRPPRTSACLTVGWVLYDDARWLVLASSKGEHTLETNARTAIPRSWVTRVTTLDGG